MKPLKIAIIVGKFPVVSETFIVNQMRFLKETGHQVDVFCFKKNDVSIHDNIDDLTRNLKVLDWNHFMPNSYWLRVIKIFGILYKSVQKGMFLNFLNSLFSKERFFNSHAFFKKYFGNYFKLENYDVIHIHFGNNAVRLLQQLKHFDKKVVVTFHGFDAHNYDYDFFSELVKINSINYTVNTEFTKRKILQLGFPESNISVLPAGIDTSFFKSNRKEHNKFNILFIGRLIELKAPLLAIQIVERLIQTNITNAYLTIIGEGEEFEICNTYIKDKELDDFVSLVGSKSQAEIVDYLNTSDAFLFPGIVDKNGRCEAQGLVIQEAQAMELPVLVSDVGGIPEGIQDGKTGFVLKSQDIDSFVQHIIILMENPKKREEMSKAARRFVKKTYDNSVLGAQLFNIYQP